MGGWNVGSFGFAPKSWNKKGNQFFFGKGAKDKSLSLLTPEQQAIQAQQENAAMGEGAGGAFGTSADYYRSLLSDDNSTMSSFAAPEMRRFNEDIIPGLSEQFAGMGSGGLSSSGFRNAAVNAGTDLAERLGAIRARLRQQGAQGLTGIGQSALNPVKENIREQAVPGFLQSAASGIVKAGIGASTGGF